jgi:hypothetical protein
MTSIAIPDRYIPNRICRRNRVVKIVVIDREGSPRPVHAANIITPHPTLQKPNDPLQYMTVQKASSWDYRLVYENNTLAAIHQLEVSDDNIKTWVSVAGAGLLAVSKIPVAPELLDFLEDPVTAALPIGFGWDGINTSVSTKNREAVNRLFANLPETWKREIANAAHDSPNTGLMPYMDFHAVRNRIDLPARMTGWDPKRKKDIRQNIPYNNVVEWVLWYRNSYVEIVKVRWGESLEFPNGVMRAAKVMRNAYISKGRAAYGVSWIYYENLEVIDAWIDDVRLMQGLPKSEITPPVMEHQ